MQRQMLLACFFVVASSGCTDDVDIAQDQGGTGGVGATGAGTSTGASSTGNGGQTQGSGAAGGAGPAGSGGVGGATGSGGSGAGPASLPECTTDDDCQLVNDCCDCEGIPADEPVNGCPADCEVPMCQALGSTPPPAAQCIAGACVAGFDCYSLVACAQPEPGCPPGQIASRTANGCWGACVPATECAAVTECANCDLGTQACVQLVSFSVSVHCLPQPDTCSGPADCACAADVFCKDPYDFCTGDGGGIISCECTTC